MADNTKAALFKYAGWLILAFSAVSVVLFFYQSINNFYKFNEIDFTSYVRASQNFYNGNNPYLATPRRFSYPLFLAVILYPMTWLQSGQIMKGFSIGLWSLGAYVSFFAVIWAGWKKLEYDSGGTLLLKEGPLIAAVIVALLHPFLQSEFINGQINLYVMAAMAGYFFMLESDRQFAASLFLAIGASIKISPGICLLYVLFTQQYRTIGYFSALFLLFNFGLPLLVNHQSMDYYNYYGTVVLHDAAEHDFLAGWRSFSIISTLSYLFKIHWNPAMKMTVISGLAVLLALPVYFTACRHSSKLNSRIRITIFSGLIAIIPLSFPISEPHHLLILTVPFIVIVHYWYKTYRAGGNPFKDYLSLLFLAVVAGLQIGHGLKDVPLRLACLIALYIGLLQLVKKMRAEIII